MAKSTKTSEQILEAAYGLFLENGFHGTSMRQVADRSDLAVAAIYNHYSSKEDLYRVVVLARHPFNAFPEAVNQAAGDNLEDYLRDAAQRLIAVLDREHKSIRLMFIEIVEFDNRHFKELAEKLLPQLQQFIQGVYLRQGDLRKMPPVLIIRSFLGFFFSYYMTESLIAPYLPKVSSKKAFESYLEIFLHGILAAGGVAE